MPLQPACSANARVRWFLLSGVAVLQLASCKGETATPMQAQVATASEVDTIAISYPQGDIFEVGKTVSLVANVLDDDGNELNTVPLTWSITRPDVVSLEDNRLTIEAPLNDSILVSASYGNKFGRFRFFAWPSVKNGEPTQVDAETEQSRWFVVRTDANTARLEVTLDGGTGDPDLYVWEPGTWEGARMICESFTPTTHERCVIENPRPGLWSIEVFAHSRGVRDVQLRALVTSR